MARFRICPHDTERWKVQKRWLGLLWVDILWNTAPDYYETLAFTSREAAEKWIDSQLELVEWRWRYKRVEQERKRTIPPQEYPPKESQHVT